MQGGTGGGGSPRLTEHPFLELNLTEVRPFFPIFLMIFHCSLVKENPNFQTETNVKNIFSAPAAG